MSEFRECIIQTKWKYDVAPEDKQVTFCYYIMEEWEQASRLGGR